MRPHRLALIISVPAVCFMTVKGGNVRCFCTHAAVHNAGRFLARVCRGREPFGSSLPGETHTEAFELSGALVNEMKPQQQLITLQLFAIFSLM